MYCVSLKVVFLCRRSTPPTCLPPAPPPPPPPQAFVWPGEPARSAGGDVQEEAGGPGGPAQTGAPPGGAQHRVHAAHLRAGGGAPPSERRPQPAGHLQAPGEQSRLLVLISKWNTSLGFGTCCGEVLSFYGALLPTQTVAVLSDLQAHELHTKHSAEAMKAEKWQFEYKNLHDKYDAQLKEKEVSRENVGK